MNGNQISTPEVHVNVSVGASRDNGVHKRGRKRAEQLIPRAMFSCCVIIALIENPINPSWLWNALPVVNPLWLLRRFVRDYESSGIPLVAGAADPPIAEHPLVRRLIRICRL